MKRKALILSVLAIVLIVFVGAKTYVTRTKPTTDLSGVSPEIAEALGRAYSPILGPEDAPVTIYEFFDPACEACRAFHPIVKDILAEHGDAVRVVLRYTPLHGEASQIAIRMLEAARMQGKFEPVLEEVLRLQPQWASHGNMRPDLLLQIGAAAGLDTDAAITQMKSPEVTGILNQDLADLATVGVKRTPTFFVNGKPVEPFGETTLRALVAAEVADAGT